MSIRFAPAAGLNLWAQPDPSSAPFTALAAGQQVDLLEETANGWARVRLTTGHEAWADAAKLVLTPPQPIAASSPSSGSSSWILAAVVFVVVAAVAGGLIGAFVFGGGDETADTLVAGEPGQEVPVQDVPPAVEGGPVFEAVPGADAAADTADAPAQGSADAPIEEVPAPAAGEVVDPLDFPDELIDRVMLEAAASPATGLPTLDAITTARLTSELLDAGIDLTGLELAVYPDSAADSFLLLETSDSTALLNAEDGGETFAADLLDSPALAEAETKRLVLRHSGTDDEGPFVVTFSLKLEDMRRAVATGEDVFADIAVQVDRP